jgi:hypothetical protein
MEMTHKLDIVMPDQNNQQQFQFWNADMDALVKTIAGGYAAEGHITHNLYWGDRISISFVVEIALKKLAEKADQIQHPTWERYINRYKELRQVKIVAATNPEKEGKPNPKRLNINLCDDCFDAIHRIGTAIDRLDEWKGARLKRGDTYNVPLIITVALLYAADVYKT